MEQRLQSHFKGHVKLVQFSHSVMSLCDPMDCIMPGLPVHYWLPVFTQIQSIESVMPSNHLVLCHPLLLLPSIFPSIRVFSNQGFFTSGDQSIGISPSTSVLPMNIQDWSPLGQTGFDLLAVQGTLKSLLQHHSSKASILWQSAFFIVQLSHPYGYWKNQSWLDGPLLAK